MLGSVVELLTICLFNLKLQERRENDGHRKTGVFEYHCVSIAISVLVVWEFGLINHELIKISSVASF